MTEYDLDLSANEIYDIIMDRIHDCNKHMRDKNAALWRLKKISYCEILDDLLNGFIDDKKYEYFKEPESADGEWEAQRSLEEIETDAAYQLRREKNKLKDILFETQGELFKYWTLVEALRKTTISGNVESVIYGRGNFDTVEDYHEELDKINKKVRKEYFKMYNL